MNCERQVLLSNEAKSRHRTPTPLIHSLLYLLLLLSAISCNFLPLLCRSVSGFASIFVVVVSDLAFAILWDPVTRVLQAAVFDAVSQSRDPDTWRVMRKSESLNVVLKNLLSKIPSTMVTIGLASRQAGLSICSCCAASGVCLIFVGGGTFMTSIKYARPLQKLRVQRDYDL